ncbi:adenine phosphoribosyltransferase [Brachybacterium alimentarium]|uniref:Adenine phosphoribosyltransferase n=2 Tax=Dermabacteraceae TaxID=85020 RepID=A0A2A3YJF6_9MICO|nr:adenine phosphoribosyltransferase [Brachybacterium alimentarium]RCS67158.1 adenine phosphoribosyltransferase [Brachybacterium sp. JB7]PCC34215.1 adenine phosphoribosyltransferase [Brachybacterium alimentarium]PCC39882.1 adenine phosphoribosyltransferase [Brachybacterium alimentarium]RCS65865.1 adenine phosphoribosyltransferase [Brachybacterium alimentarium]RCS69812.1 adenine phosphoribosyltransferase [Brachybacterium alimentarium]
MPEDMPSVEEIRALRTSHIAEYPDFPVPGVLFRDITPLLRDHAALRAVIRHWISLLPGDIEYVVGTEARGFVLGAPLAYELGAGFIPVRKAGKLPGTPASVSYDLEYGSAVVEIAEGSLPAGARTLVIDDLLATGGTAAATVELVRQFDVDLVGASFLIELEGLGGRDKLPDIPLSVVWSFPN